MCSLGYSLAVHVYSMQDEHPIPVDVLEKTVLSIAMSFYDGASNGNRTRGGVRKASDMYAFTEEQGDLLLTRIIVWLLFKAIFPTRVLLVKPMPCLRPLIPCRSTHLLCNMLSPFNPSTSEQARTQCP